MLTLKKVLFIEKNMKLLGYSVQIRSSEYYNFTVTVGQVFVSVCAFNIYEKITFKQNDKV